MKAQAHKPSALMGPCGHVGMWTWNARGSARGLWLAIIMLTGGTSVFAQGKGEVRLAVQPRKGLQYILDGKERLSNPGVMLEPGPHRFVFWAPDRVILDTTVQVMADSVIILRKVLPPTEAYRAHVKAMHHAGLTRTAYRVVPVVLTGAAAALAISANKKRVEADDALRAAESQYAVERNPVGITFLKATEIPAKQEELDRAHRRTIIWSGATLLGVAATVAGFIKAARVEHPMYEDREKVRFDAMAWSENGGFGLYATLQIPLR